MAGERGGSWLNPFDNIVDATSRGARNATSSLVSFSGGDLTPFGIDLFKSPAPTVGATGGSYTPPPITTNNYQPPGGQVLGDSDTPVLSAADRALYDQAIGNTQAGIDRLGGSLESGYSSIEASFKDALNQLLLSKNQGQTAYDTNKLQSARGYVGAKNTIGAQAGESLNGLLRLLGSRGAGGGSAARIAAPQAVTRGASIQRGEAGQTFGENEQALDTNWNNFLTSYNNEVASANSQRDRGRAELERGINTDRANLLQSLAQLQAQKSGAGAAQPYLDQANQLLNRTSNYQVAPINYQTQAYKAPDISSYTTNPNATPQFNQNGANDYFSPYLQALLGKKQQIARV